MELDCHISTFLFISFEFSMKYDLEVFECEGLVWFDAIGSVSYLNFSML